MLKKWAAAEGKPSDETELATKLVEDFSRFPTVDAMHGQLIGASGAGGAAPPDGSELPKVEGVRVPMVAAATDGQPKDSKEAITPVVVGAASAAEGGGPRRLGQHVERLAVEDVELHGIVAAADRVGETMGERDVEVARAHCSVDRLGDLDATIARQDDCRAHAAPCPVAQRLT